MLRRRTLLAAGLAALVGVPVRAGAQTSIRPDPSPRLPPQPGQGLALEDRRSLQRAALLSDVQIEAGRLGAERAAAPDVKQLAASIAEAHSGFRRRVGELAGEYGVDLQGREAAGIEDRSLEALRNASGEAFDRAFLARQLGLYPRVAEVYQRMASNSPQVGISRFGIMALAEVRAHFETARALGARFGLRAETVENPPQY